MLPKICFSWPTRRTDGHARSQAPPQGHVGAKKLKLDEETRWQVADEAVEELRREVEELRRE